MTARLIEATIPDWLVRPSKAEPRRRQEVNDKDRGEERGLVPGMCLTFTTADAILLIDGKVSFVCEDREPHEKPEEARRDQLDRVWTSLTVRVDGDKVWQGGENWHVKDHYHIANFSRHVAVGAGQHAVEVSAIYARKNADFKDARVYFKEDRHHHLTVVVLPTASPTA